MNRTSAMKRSLIAHGLAAVLMGSVSLIAIAGSNGDAIVQTAGNVPYVSGGVGDDSIERLDSLAKDFNLKLVFALSSGAYLSGVSVAIADTAGKTLLDATSSGPWLLVRLPAGNYRVIASFGGKAKEHRIAVGNAGLKTVDFRWESE